MPSPLSTLAYSTFRPSGSLRNAPSITETREEDRQPLKPEEEESALEGESPSEPDVPWYLQVEPPKHSALIYEPPPLPEIPEDAPKVLAPLLKHVSDELGLDNLNFLDLRSLDPPAALGPDLMMLFGTARSERHLHVSAGRLVQWLRSRGIKADADGLLGRNELKTRLRRKARKAKLLGNNGVARGGDDGISTGWVCINMGTLGWSISEDTVIGPDGRTAGFGSPHTGTTLVIQMFTEARREELRLENLWNGLLKRSHAQKRALSDDGGSPSAENGAQPIPTGLSQPTGRRMFSTVVSRSDDPRTRWKALLDEPLNGTSALSTILEALSDNTMSKMSLMKRIKEHVLALPRTDAIQLLTPSSDGKPNAFHRVFDLVLQNLPAEEVWSARLWLLASSQSLGIEVPDPTQIKRLVRDLQTIPVVADPAQYSMLIKSIFAVPAVEDAAAREQATLALQVVDTMYERGKRVITNSVIVDVIEAVVRSGARSNEAERLLAAFEFLLVQADLPCPSENLLLRLLDAYASAGNWDKFWKTWRIPPKHCQPRSPRMYSYLYRRFAEDGHQARSIDALRWCVNEMVNEEPPVAPKGDVLEALRACIKIADPHAERIAQTVVVKDKKSEILANREFVKLCRELGVGQS